MLFRSDSVFMTEQKLKRLELCQQQTFTTLRGCRLSAGSEWRLVNGCQCHLSPHSRLLSNFNDFFKDFPVKMLWPDQFKFTRADRVGRVLYWKIYRLASHKKDLAQILCVAGSGPGKYETIINTGQEWFYSHRHHTRVEREETVCSGLITFVLAKLPE